MSNPLSFLGWRRPRPAAAAPPPAQVAPPKNGTYRINFTDRKVEVTTYLTNGNGAPILSVYSYEEARQHDTNLCALADTLEASVKAGESKP